MCGIAGILNFDGRPVLEGELRAMTHAIAHRGPDGEGIYANGPLGLGHRRLAILDLSDTGRQPMSFADGRYWIVYNGEVYNFVELRRELEARGYAFRSTGDTEVVLAAYDCWGSDCLSRFNGMWAFAIWDGWQRKLFLARDRFGVKPVFFFCTPQRFAFASEIKALLRIEGIPIRPNLGVIRDILQGGNPDFRDETVFSNVYRLKAGAWVIVTPEGMGTEKTWFDLWSHRVEVPQDKRQQEQMFLELFEDACRIRLRSDVPIGTLLSGGVDSSAIVSTIARHRDDPYWVGSEQRLSPDWQRTFTAKYPNLSADEGEYPDCVLRSLGINGVSVYPTVDEIGSFVQRMVEQQDTPVDQSLYAVHSVYRTVSQYGVKVTLDGQGADEVLSGYEAITAACHYLSNGNLIEAWRAIECQTALTPATGTFIDILHRVLLLTLQNEVRRLPRLRSVVRRLRGARGQSGAESACGAPSAALLALPDSAHDWSRPRDFNLLDAELYRQVCQSSLPGILRKFDHAAMAYSVESRMPFLDWRLIAFCFSLPVQQKVSRGYTKVILRRALKDSVVPAVLGRRSKLGFPIPHEWLSSQAVSSWVPGVIYDPRFGQMEYWNGKRFRDWFETKSRANSWNGRDLSNIFLVLSTFLWHDRFCG